MRIYHLVSIGICILFLSGCSPKINTSGNQKGKAKTEKSAPQFAFNFTESEMLMPLLEKAGKEDKLVFIDFYTTWCLPCKLMEEDVFMDKDLANFYNTEFINYKVDAEKGNGVNLAALFEVKAYPTLLYLDKNGRVLERKEGAAYQSEMRRLANNAISKNN